MPRVIFVLHRPAEGDLPLRELGVDIVHDFQPQYELTLNGKLVLKDLKAAAP